MMTEDSVDKLREAAEAAEAIAPSPWLVRPQEFDDWGIIRQSAVNRDGFQPIVTRVLASSDDRLDQDTMSVHRKNKTDPYDEVSHFIALANPQAVTELLDERDALRARVEELEAALEPFAKLANSEHYSTLARGDGIDDWPVSYTKGLRLGDLRRARYYYGRG